MAKKKSRQVELLVVTENGVPDGRRSLAVRDRMLTFGEKWSYAPAPEANNYIQLKTRYQLFINGKFVAPHSGKYFPSINPATEEKLAEIAEGDAHDVDRAVKAARAAYKNVWSKMPGRERGKYLYRIARLIQEKSRELAVLETMDGGKPIKESRDVDLPLVAAHFFYYAGWADKLEYAFPGRTPRPLGVAGQIIPWNFPLLMAAWKLAPALACGNTVVLKPAETTSITAMHLAEILQEAELPDGVVNIVTGAAKPGGRWSSTMTSTRSRSPARPKSASCIAQSGRRHEEEAHARARRQGGEHRLRRRADRSGGRRHHRRDLFQPGPRLLRRLALARAGRRLPAGDSQAARSHRHAARRRSARQKHRHRRDQFADAAREDPRAGRQRRCSRARSWCSRAAGCRRRATGFRRASSPA